MLNAHNSVYFACSDNGQQYQEVAITLSFLLCRTGQWESGHHVQCHSGPNLGSVT